MPIGYEPVLTFDPRESLNIDKTGLVLPVNLAPSTTFSRGTVLGCVSGSANHVHTLTVTSTVSGGTFTLSVYNPLRQQTYQISHNGSSALAYNISNADLQAALEVAFGVGNVVVAGSALPTGPLTFTFQGDLAGMPVPVPTLGIGSLTGGGSYAIASTTIGRSRDTYTPYASLKLANPSTAPSCSGTGAAGSFAAGSYVVSYTLVTAEGETLPSPATTIALTAGQSLRIAAISSLDSRVVAVNYYVNGLFAGSKTVTNGTATQTDIVAGSITGTLQPRNNTTGAPRAILPVSCVTDASGRVVQGSVTGVGPQFETGYSAVAAYFDGCFRTTDLVGLDSDAVALLGRVIKGDLTNGIIKL